MTIIKREYPLLDGDANNIPQLIKKVNHDLDNIIKAMNNLGFETGGQQQTYIYNIETISNAGSVNMVEIPFSYDRTSFSVNLNAKLLWIILSIKTGFTRGTQIEVSQGTTKLIWKEWANQGTIKLHLESVTAFSFAYDSKGLINFVLFGNPSIGAGNIVLITA